MSDKRKLNVLNISILKEIWLKSIKTEYFVDTKFSKQLVKKTIKKIKHGLDQFIPFACQKGFITAGKKVD